MADVNYQALLIVIIIVAPEFSQNEVLATDSLSSDEVGENRPNIILDTDIGSDCDDAGAQAVLHKLADHNEANILGVIYSSDKNRYGVGVYDAINTYYGRGDLPLGQYKRDDVDDPRDHYSKEIAKA